MEFRIDVIHLDGAVLVSLSGELDAAGAPALQQCLANLVAEGTTTAEIDLSELHYVDSIGLSVLVSTRNRLRDSGGSLVVSNPTPRVLKVIEITGLTSHLLAKHDPASTVDDAVLPESDQSEPGRRLLREFERPG